MIGFAFETNKIISLIKDEKIKEKYDEKGQMIWDKWQEKIKSTVNGFDLMQAINKTMEKETKSQEDKMEDNLNLFGFGQLPKKEIVRAASIKNIVKKILIQKI